MNEQPELASSIKSAGERGVMQQLDPLHSTEPRGSVRTLKIEEDGDAWKGLTKPKIRLMGRWLERAGFTPGDRVQVICVSRGLIELRSSNGLKNEMKLSC